MKRSKTSTTQVNVRHKNKTHTTHSTLSEVHPGSSNPSSQESKTSDSVMKWGVVQGNVYSHNMFTGRFLTIGAYLVSTGKDDSRTVIPTSVTFPLPPRQAYVTSVASV